MPERSHHDAWHPGLKSELPADLLPLVTLFRPENSDISYAEARELSDFSGLPPIDLISFRPERLAQHEVLVWVTANLSVPDGPSYEELGINLRAMVATIYDKHVAPRMETVHAAFAKLRADADEVIRRELDSQLYRKPERDAGVPPRRSFVMRLFGAKSPPVKAAPAPEHPELVAIARWQERLAVCGDAIEKACLDTLIKVVGAVSGHRGRLPPDPDLMDRIALNYVSSFHSSSTIAEAIAPFLRSAAAAEGYRILPVQEKPTVMNVKGASAAGKSTIRPQQRRLAEQLGIPWEDFALISPDYWRKYLFDYSSLGADYKYAAMLTGQELEIIDKKLDHHMAMKASRGEMSHLLIDRFRFDSFVVENDRSSDSKLLTRFGDRIFLFFMITPPAETVERAWQRGLKTGRYKAVDDLLYHNVEAYTGMPGLFFSWVRSRDKRIHFEFLDNDVPEGDLPKTAAFGWNDAMYILDVDVMINIDRFRKVNVQAKQPDEIFRPEEMPAARNVGFLLKCATQIPTVTFADQSSGDVYAQVMNGKLAWCDHAYIERQGHGSGVQVALTALGYDRSKETSADRREGMAIDVDAEKHYTLGRWLGD